MNKLQQSIIENYTKNKIDNKNFTFRNYLDIKKQLRKKNIKDTLVQRKTLKQKRELQSKPEVRDVPYNTQDNIVCASAIAGFVGTVATTNSLMENPSAGSLLLSGIAGLSLGSAIGVANILAYADKPLTNAINKIMIKSKDRKIKRLTKKKELRNYTLYCFRKNLKKNTPSYDDFLKEIKQKDITREM